RRHTEHFRDLVESFAPGFFYRVAAAGKEQGAQAARLDDESDNVRTALEWAANHHVQTGLRIVIAMNWYWQRRGTFAGGRAWVGRTDPSGSGGERRALG